MIKKHDLCVSESPPVLTGGIWNNDDIRFYMNNDLIRFLIQIVLVHTVSELLFKLLRRFNLSRLVCQILAGGILGQAVLGIIFPKVFNMVFKTKGPLHMAIVARLGSIFFMFITGVKMDPSLVFKSGKKAWIIAVSSMVFPTVYSTIIAAFTFSPNLRFVLATQTYTSFPVIAHQLIDLKMTNSELGRITLASSLIRDIITTITGTILTMLRIYSNTRFEDCLVTFVLFLSFIAFIVFIARPTFLWIIKQTPEGKPVKPVYISLILFAALFSAFITDNLGVIYHTGPFYLGLSVPSGPPLGSTLEKRFIAIMGLAVPIIVSYGGIIADFTKASDLGLYYSLWITFVGSFIVKLAGGVISGWMSKMSAKDGLVVGTIMASQGIVELVGYVFYRVTLSIDGDTFNMELINVLTTAVVVPIIVRSVHDFSRTYIGYQKRNILHSSQNAELRIVACAHKQDDAMAVIKVLEASNPTKDSPLSVYALHLLELVGGATPLMINHQLGQSSSLSRSQPIIDIFNVYQHQTSGLVNVHPFTAISMPKFMHDDVCLLAFDKLASLIILPFHKKWNSQGKVVFDNKIMRNLNIRVMDIAPCSVGILIDRRKVQHEPATSLLYRVAVIFLGGDDDREVLSYAKRMASTPGVHMTVFRLSPCDESVERNWESILDAESLKDLRLEFLKNAKEGNVVYHEVNLKDGTETASFIQSMEEDYELIMVGRRHKPDNKLLRGLSEWVELPELGEIGDLLASPDIDKPFSVLVMQQQHMQ